MSSSSPTSAATAAATAAPPRNKRTGVFIAGIVLSVLAIYTAMSYAFPSASGNDVVVVNEIASSPNNNNNNDNQQSQQQQQQQSASSPSLSSITSSSSALLSNIFSSFFGGGETTNKPEETTSHEVTTKPEETPAKGEEKEDKKKPTEPAAPTGRFARPTLDPEAPPTPSPEKDVRKRNKEFAHEWKLPDDCDIPSKSFNVSQLPPRPPMPGRTDDEKFGIDSNWWDDPTQTRETSVEDRVLRLPLAIARRQFSRILWDQMKDPRLDVICNLAITATKNCDQWKDTLAECVMKYTFKNWEMLLGQRCINQHFWKTTLPALLVEYFNYTREDGPIGGVISAEPDAWKTMNRGTMWDSYIMKEEDVPKRTRYIPPEERFVAPFPPPRICRNGCVHHPAGYGVPLETFEKSVPRTKSFGFMPLMPKTAPATGAYEAKIEEEDLFNEMVVQSLFSYSHKRGGWVCGRTYGILAAGTIPFFWDLEHAPRNTLGHYPKKLLIEAMHLPGVEHMRKCFYNDFTQPGPNGMRNFRRQGDIRRSNDPSTPIFNLTKYYELADKIHDYARKYMTSRAVAAYMLKTMGAENAKTAIFFDRDTNDMFAQVIIHGLVDLGVNVTHVSKQNNYDFLYKIVNKDGIMSRPDRDRWIAPQHNHTYGAAYSFQGRFPEARMPRNWVRDPKTILADLQEGKFDTAFFQLSGAHYEYIKEAHVSGKTKVAFVQFRDEHGDPDGNTMQACQFNGTIFIREMSDRQC